MGPANAAAAGPYVDFPEVGVVWTTAVAWCGASAETKPFSGGTAKAEAKAVSAAGEVSPRPGRLSMVLTDAETRAKTFPEGAVRSSILIRDQCVRKWRTPAEVKGSPP